MTCTEGAVALAEGRTILSAMFKKSVEVKMSRLDSKTERCKGELLEEMMGKWGDPKNSTADTV